MSLFVRAKILHVSDDQHSTVPSFILQSQAMHLYLTCTQTKETEHANCVIITQNMFVTHQWNRRPDQTEAKMLLPHCLGGGGGFQSISTLKDVHRYHLYPTSYIHCVATCEELQTANIFYLEKEKFPMDLEADSSSNVRFREILNKTFIARFDFHISFVFLNIKWSRLNCMTHVLTGDHTEHLISADD